MKCFVEVTQFASVLEHERSRAEEVAYVGRAGDFAHLMPVRLTCESNCSIKSFT
jgi:hypothetical protein